MNLWDGLAHTHKSLLDLYGFDTFKRHINFYYGQWAVSRPTNWLIRTLALKLISRGRLPWPAKVDWSDTDNIHWPHGGDKNWIRLRSYALYCGLLWQYAKLSDRVGCLELPEPVYGSPMPVWFKGRLISQDLALSSLDINRMAEVISFKQGMKVLEIGAGYGRLAYALRSLFDVDYTIVDIEPALTVARKYLGYDYRYRTPADFEKTTRSYDLVVNVSSFDEMPHDVSANYLKIINRVCTSHLYLSGYRIGQQNGNGLDQLDYPKNWKLMLDKPHAFVPHWVDKIFYISASSSR